MDNYPLRIETLLRRYLKAQRRGQYYGIDADNGNDSEGIWSMSWAVLTVEQFCNPNKEKEIVDFLDRNYNFVSDNKSMSDWDEEVMIKFYNDLEKLLGM